MIHVLFVCMGNICRSPMAEAVFRHHVDQAGLADAIAIESAGTHAYHVGEPPHRSTLAELQRRGVAAGDQRARVVLAEDLDAFDYVVAMDTDNLEELRALCDAAPHAHLSRLLDHAVDTDTRDVPDPYYVGGYDIVFDLVDAGSAGLLQLICDREALHAPA